MTDQEELDCYILKDAARKACAAFDEYYFFLDGYRNGSASTAEVNHYYEEFNKAIEKLKELTND